MGLDIVELMMRVEEEFDIEISDADAQGIETAGALSTYVALRVGWERREAIWLGLRDLIAEEFAIPPEQITPESHFVYDLGLN